MAKVATRCCPSKPGPRGIQGVGIQSITQPSGPLSAVVTLTDGSTQTLALPQGQMGQGIAQNLLFSNGVISISGGNSVNIRGPQLISRFGTFIGHLLAE